MKRQRETLTKPEQIKRDEEWIKEYIQTYLDSTTRVFIISKEDMLDALKPDRTFKGILNDNEEVSKFNENIPNSFTLLYQKMNTLALDKGLHKDIDAYLSYDAGIIVLPISQFIKNKVEKVRNVRITAVEAQNGPTYVYKTETFYCPTALEAMVCLSVLAFDFTNVIKQMNLTVNFGNPVSFLTAIWAMAHLETNYSSQHNLILYIQSSQRWLVRLMILLGQNTTQDSSTLNTLAIMVIKHALLIDNDRQPLRQAPLRAGMYNKKNVFVKRVAQIANVL
jgi:hypothetical protein